MNWEFLIKEANSCINCGLHINRNPHAVVGFGNRNSPLLIIGLAPGVTESHTGKPFDGPAGKLLDKALLECEITRDDVYTTNLVFCHPKALTVYGNPTNRDPIQEEITSCKPFLDRIVDLINPKLILCVGKLPAQQIINPNFQIMKMRGLFYDSRYRNKKGELILASSIVHTSYLIRQDPSSEEYKQGYEILIGDLTRVRDKIREMNRI